MMLNSIDYYDYVAGEFDYNFIESYRVKFEIEEDSTPGSRVTAEKNNLTFYEHVANETQISFADYSSQKVSSLSKTKDSKKPIGPRVKKAKGLNNEEVNEYIYRVDPAAGNLAEVVTFPQEFAFWLNDESPNYRISGKEIYLNRNAVIVDGTVPADLSEKLSSDTFKFWIDSQTGVLLKALTFDKSGNITNSLVVNDITFNKKELTDGKFDVDAKFIFEK